MSPLTIHLRQKLKKYWLLVFVSHMMEAFPSFIDQREVLVTVNLTQIITL